MRPLFKNNDLQEEWSRQGYIKLPLLNPSQITELQAFYESTSSGIGDLAFHSTMFSPRPEYRRMVSGYIYEKVKQTLDAHLTEMKCLFGNYIIKEANQDNAVGIHQDWNCVDEQQYDSVNVWSPMVDVDEANGLFYVLPRSHREMENIRYTPFSSKPYEGLEDEIKSKAELVSFTAGEALFYHPALVHFSMPNRSEYVRPAVGLALIPQEAQALHYHRTEGQMNVYNVDAEFFTAFDMVNEPEADLKESLTYENLMDGQEGLKKLLSEMEVQR